MITAYASVGQNFISSTLNANTNFSLGSTSTLNFDFPLEFNMPNTSEMQASAGVRLQFAIFTLYANQPFLAIQVHRQELASVLDDTINFQMYFSLAIVVIAMVKISKQDLLLVLALPGIWRPIRWF